MTRDDDMPAWIAKLEADTHARFGEVELRLHACIETIRRLERSVESLEEALTLMGETLSKFERFVSHQADALTSIRLKLDRVVKHAEDEDALQPKMMGRLDAILEAMCADRDSKEHILTRALDEDVKPSAPRPAPTPNARGGR